MDETVKTYHFSKRLEPRVHNQAGGPFKFDAYFPQKLEPTFLVRQRLQLNVSSLFERTTSRLLGLRKQRLKVDVFLDISYRNSPIK